MGHCLFLVITILGFKKRQLIAISAVIVAGIVILAGYFIILSPFDDFEIEINPTNCNK